MPQMSPLSWILIFISLMINLILIMETLKISHKPIILKQNILKMKKPLLW